MITNATDWLLAAIAGSFLVFSLALIYFSATRGRKHTK